MTAGNSSGLNDGAVALLMASGEAVEQHGLKPLARVVSSAVAGVEPRIMGIGPVEASKKALAKAGLTLDDMDIIELNEAFAAQVLACTRELGLADNDERINPNGGAIALGHPLGVTGGRILHSAALELQETGKKYALVSMCIGVGRVCHHFRTRKMAIYQFLDFIPVVHPHLRTSPSECDGRCDRWAALLHRTRGSAPW